MSAAIVRRSLLWLLFVGNKRRRELLGILDDLNHNPRIKRTIKATSVLHKRFFAASDSSLVRYPCLQSGWRWSMVGGGRLHRTCCKAITHSQRITVRPAINSTDAIHPGHQVASAPARADVHPQSSVVDGPW